MPLKGLYIELQESFKELVPPEMSKVVSLIFGFLNLNSLLIISAVDIA